ncbi:MAG: MBL fold metallo-hydrolase [Xanthomonadales bacterium]|nr:MBL fold metallo-hydrolase [Xanthomonadales bacterium]
MDTKIIDFYDPDTGTFSYLLVCQETRQAAVIDPVLDLDICAGKVSTRSADQILAQAAENELQIQWILETHCHADHLTAADYLREKTGAQVAIGSGIQSVAANFAHLFEARLDLFDHLLEDGEEITVGNARIEVLATPGHTNDSLSYGWGDALFVGDTVFPPDIGSARCDFPGGDASVLYDTLVKIHDRPADSWLYFCHDYPPEHRPKPWCSSTVSDSRGHNIHIGDNFTREAFVEMREGRDANLPVPKLLYPSLQVNLCAGRLPDEGENGVSYLRIPLL